MSPDAFARIPRTLPISASPTALSCLAGGQKAKLKTSTSSPKEACMNKTRNHFNIRLFWGGEGLESRGGW